MRKFLLSLSFIIALCSATKAAPADPTPVKLLQPDGTTVTAILNGDEYFHFFTTYDGYAIEMNSDGFYHYITGIGNNRYTLSSMPAKDMADRDDMTVEMLEKLDRNGISNIISQNAKTVKMKKSAAKAMSRIQAFPNKGEAHGLVILVEFADQEFLEENTKDKFHKMLNEEGYTDTNSNGSAADYFKSQSHDQFTPVFDVYGPVKLSGTYASYGSNNTSGDDIAAHAMIKEACQLLDGEIDFSDYDSNNDGKVDLVFALYAGYGENGGAGSDRIWPHASDLSYYYNEPVTFDGKEIGPYACSCELRGNQTTKPVTTAGIGVFCHEFSHCLGLYDLYDTNGSTGGQGKGFGKYSIMDQGCYNNLGFTPCSYTAMERMMIGWLTPTEPESKLSTLKLQDLNKENQAYILYNPNNRNEYFLLENRQLTGWDKYLPGHGMLISHINYDKEQWEQNLVNATQDGEGAMIVPANNKYNSGEESHLYPAEGNDSFTDISEPAAVFRDGTLAESPVTDIREDAEGNIIFTYMDIILTKPVALEATDITGNGFTANWESVKGATSYSLTVTPIAEVEYPDAIIYEDFSLFSAGSPTSPNNSDISSKLDNYTSVAGWKGSKVYQAGGMCKTGTTTAAGYLLTPKIRMPQTYTILVDACDYVTTSGKGDNSILYIGTIVDGENEFHDYKEFPLTSEMTTYSLKGTNGGKNMYVQIGTVIDRAILDNIVVSSGNITKAPAEIPAFIINDIEGTSYKVTGLQKSYKYSYTVQATAGDKVSEQSDIIYVTTASSILNPEDASMTVYGNNGVMYFNTEVPVNAAVFTIDGKQIFNGTLQGNTAMKMDNGIYIVIINGKSYKVAI